MSKHIVSCVILASAVTMVTGCAVETVSYSSGYTTVYSPATDYYAANYGTYPSYYWGYQNYYTPAYFVGGYNGGWGGGYRGGWGHRHWHR